MTLKLGCYFLPKDRFFTVQADANHYVSDLQEIVHEKLAKYHVVPLDTLKLYKADLPLEPKADRVDRVRKWLLDNGDRSLDEGEDLSQISAAQGRIQILIDTTFKNLTCLVSGDPPTSQFEVGIDNDKNVSDLKDAVREKTLNRLGDVTAFDLYLKNSAHPLDPSCKISAVFPNLYEDHHVIVAPNDMPIYYFACRNGDVPTRSSLERMKANNQIHELERAIAARVRANVVGLWKPRNFLHFENDEELRSRLKEAGGEFGKFCDSVVWREDGTKTISTLFSRSARKATWTTLVAEIEILPSRVRKAEEESEHHGLMKRFKKAVGAGQKATPSVSSKPVQYLEFQNGEVPILDGRYGDRINDISIPVEIYNPAFAVFLGLTRDTTFTPHDDIVKHTVELMNAASKIETAENRRQSTTRQLLGQILNLSVTQTANMNKTSSDHLVLYSCGGDPSGIAALVIIEEKAELGTSGEGSVQGSFSYYQHWADLGQKNLSNACCCPSFIISIAGPWIVVLGAVFTSAVIVQRLTDYIWLGHSRAIDDSNTFRIARIFAALRDSVGVLQSFYATISPPEHDTDRFFPGVTSYCTENHEIVNFRYTRHLKDDQSCAAFLAKCPDGRKLVVKFVERYGSDAHRLLAEKGLAPALLYYGDIHHESLRRDGTRPRMMVVMEYIEAEDEEETVISDEVRDAVRKALECLHSANLVHGDIRRPNIIVARGEGSAGRRTKILDFDWAGQEGSVKYPLRLSPGIWTHGVDDCAVILRKHDLEMVERL